MVTSQQQEAQLRFFEGTSEQRAAVELNFPEAVAKGWRCLGVMFGPAVAAPGPSGRAASPRYAIRKGLRGWKLMFEGEVEVLPDVFAVYYVAYLLRFPPLEPMHASELAHRALGDAVVTGQRNVGADDGETLEQQRQARRKCLAVLEDEEASAEMKEAAERELAEINEWALKHQRGTVGGVEKQARGVRVAIRRLLDELAVATDESNGPHVVLRSFGNHLERYLWQPSSRGCGSRQARVQSGLAGSFVYEPPTGVKWVR